MTSLRGPGAKQPLGSRGALLAPRSRRAALIETALWLSPLALTVGFYCAFIQRSSFSDSGRRVYTLFDDAMISMRYARNLVEGHGLVWNPGEAPVEGYTNPLWTLWMAVLHLVGVPEATVSLLVSASGGLLLLATALVVRAIARRLYPESGWIGTVALWGTALYYPLVFWTLRGMEVGLIALLIALSVWLSLKLKERFSWSDIAALALATSLGVLTRMEFIVPAATIACFTVFWSKGHRLAVGGMLGGALLVTVGALTVFRILYYDDVLPNTYYLKVAGVSQFTRFGRGLTSLEYMYLTGLSGLVVLACCHVARYGRRVRQEEWLLLAVFAALALYSVEVGGDTWEYFAIANRYVAPVVPLLLIVALGSIEAFRSPLVSLDLRLVILCTAVLVLTALCNLWLVRELASIQVYSPEPRDTRVDVFRAMGALGVASWLILLRLAPLRPRLGRLVCSRPAAVMIGLALVVYMSAVPFGSWVRFGAAEDSTEAGRAAYGFLLRETTDPQATIALSAAGAIPYFSHRATVDELGKSDKVIAKGPMVRDTFHPGHTKWNYAHSIGELRPDLIAQVFILDRHDVAGIFDWGYEWITGTCFVRADSELVDVDALRSGLKRLRANPRLPWEICGSRPEVGLP